MKRTIAENFIYNVINAIFTFVIGVALSIALARLLDPADYGAYHLISWVIGILGLISLMGFPTAVEKYVSEYEGRQDRDNLKKIIRFVLNIEFLWGMFVAVLFIVFADKLSLWLKHPEFKKLFWIAALVIIPSAVGSILSSISRGLQIFRTIMIANIIALPLLLGLALLVLRKGGGVAGILWVHLGITLINLMIFYLLLKNVLSIGRGANLVWPIRKKILNFSVTLLGTMILDSIIWQKSGVFFLTIFRTAEEVGYYGLAFGVAAMAVRFIPESFAGVIRPVLSHRYGAQDRVGLNQVFIKSTRYLMLMTVPICIGIITMANPLIELVYGKRYLPAVGILPVLVIASGIGGISYTASGIVYGTEKQNIALVILSLVAALNLTMDVLLIPRYGIYGAAIATSVAQGAGVFLAFLWIHVKMKFRFPLVSLAKTFLAGAIAAGIIYFSTAVWGKDLWHLILSLIMGEGIYVFIICLTQKTEIRELKNYFYGYLKREAVSRP